MVLFTSTLRKTNITDTEHGPGLKAYFLLKIEGCFIAMSVYQRVCFFFHFPRESSRPLFKKIVTTGIVDYKPLHKQRRLYVIII